MAIPKVERLTPGSWLLPGPTNLGLIVRGKDAYLVDSGNDREAGRGIRQLLDAEGLGLKAIISTHSNADHIGGNAYLQGSTGCRIYATRVERALIENPELEAAMLWGGNPDPALDSKFFRAQPSIVTDVVEDMELLAGEGIHLVPLPGHFLGMVGVRTDEGLFHAADALFDLPVLEKHRIPFIYDVQAFRDSLRLVAGAAAEFYVMSHGAVTRDIRPVVEANLALVDRVEEAILGMIDGSRGFDELLEGLCGRFGVALNAASYALVGSTLRSFLSHLRRAGRIVPAYEGGRLRWSLSG